ncbi:MAG: DUF3568 family protein [Isosphaeraceae bacterium]|nr:DUF3568 family protein [Isosphaeraceae bacterium]
MRRIGMVAALLSLLSGCKTVVPALPGPAPAAGLFAFHGGQGEQVFPRPSDQVREAVLGALAETRVHAIHQSRDRGTLVLDGTAADGRHVHLTIQPQGPRTLVTARFGRFGDELRSHDLFDAIGHRLGLPAAGEDQPQEHVPLFSREAVPDAMMLRDHTDSFYRDTPAP